MGGINIFGRHFGNYAQDIVLTISKDIKDKSNYDL
jgi:predicted transcriptional regulator